MSDAGRFALLELDDTPPGAAQAPAVPAADPESIARVRALELGEPPPHTPAPRPAAPTRLPVPVPVRTPAPPGETGSERYDRIHGRAADMRPPTTVTVAATALEVELERLRAENERLTRQTQAQAAEYERKRAQERWAEHDRQQAELARARLGPEAPAYESIVGQYGGTLSGGAEDATLANVMGPVTTHTQALDRLRRSQERVRQLEAEARGNSAGPRLRFNPGKPPFGGAFGGGSF